MVEPSAAQAGQGEHYGDHAVVTDEVIEAARDDVTRGVERLVVRQWHSEASLDSVRHWAWAIGDDNPLWTEPEYAQRTLHGSVLAPPSFLFSCTQGPNHFRSEATRGSGQPGLHAIWSSDRWAWHRFVTRGTRIVVTKRPFDVVVREAEHLVDRTMEIVTRFELGDGAGYPLATYDQAVQYRSRGRTPRAPRGDGGDGSASRETWTEETLDKLRSDVAAEVRLGGQVRHGAEVSAGDEIPAVVKGPLTVTEIIAFITGYGGPFIMASELTHRYIQQHPRANVPDSQTGAPDFPERAHWDGAFAKACGFPDAYDFGGQRIAWLTHAVTNWMGDEGELVALRCKLHAMNVVGDATWCAGEVIDCQPEQDGRYRVEIHLHGVNQRGVTTVSGEATVRVPA